MELSKTEEDYLKTLLALSEEGNEVGMGELSKLLAVKTPTATSMIKKLSAKGYVLYEKYRPLSLTVPGYKAAALILRKHRLTEMFLVQEMGFGWEEVHDIAEQVEHIRAPRFFEKMDEVLGFPKFDPHGSPIPDREGKITATSYIKLSECQQGDRFLFAAVTNSSRDFLQFLNSRDLQLGSYLEIQMVEPYDHSITVSYQDREKETFSQVVCEKLLGEKV
jgi:DtxR family Mn-dependent transcriptional regulator